MMPARRASSAALAPLLGRTTILAIVVALLAVGTLAMAPQSNTHAATKSGERSATPRSERDAMGRFAPVHAMVAVVTRFSPELIRGGNGPRAVAIADAARSTAGDATSGPGAVVDACSREVATPGLPALWSRAPPMC
jgi:hypothetical protein